MTSEVNTEICQLGSILYFRTVQDVPVGTELVTDYGRHLNWFPACASGGRSRKPQNLLSGIGPGYSYWPDFDSCQLVTANDLMARLEKRSTR